MVSSTNGNGETTYTMSKKDVELLIRQATNGQTSFWKKIGWVVVSTVVIAVLGAAVKFVVMDERVSNNTRDIVAVQEDLKSLPRIEGKLELIIADVQDLKKGR